ncbi:probable serine/threonine-protein kinase DDB_G0282963 isoform X2 [Acyrthosiphon pisum]|uniref:Mediator of DNA damage checkpoint protein 1 n=1 Tax=Acyrthosiphon pisum TaxID=7029 RepID=A0A8R1WYK2_ACYPI|nr:probable serine/threonine-protein kinase DDB_G0282963 isoform X2 [Acyrthosiphon pisum]|eukprot:XP_008179404.1 PREDICTED: probable serine/threonine-protein kinase DDB_G0282963 isoform X2 [Acyrthosiphon pisum]
MDADVDSAWICTQAIVSTDSQSDDEQEKIKNYGYIVLNDMIDNERYVLKEGDNTIGRHPLNHIYIEHPSVSMNHAVIQCDSDGVVLLDKGSLNKTKLNKKTLRKDVAYFLEENALLMFGEVQADYFINENSIEFKNDTKSMAPDNTFVHKATQNDGLSLSKLSNVITQKSFRTDIPNAISDCNVPLVIENKSTCKIEKEVPKTITGTESAMNTLNDLHTKFNSSSPSDEYLLEALSQVETKQNNVNSNEIVHNLSNEDTHIMNLTESVSEITREDTPSPVMDLQSSILTINNITKNQFQTPNKINTEWMREDTPSPVMDLKSSILTTNNVTKNQFQSPNKINTEEMREDTPSPVMDLKNSILTTNSIPKCIFQSPSKINKELIREDTPSPIMDFGCCNDFENYLETNNHGIISAIQSPNEVNKFNNTQVLEIDNNIVELYTHTSNNDEAQNIESDEQSIIPIKNCLDISSKDNLSGSNNINLSTNGHNTDKHKIIVNTFEAEDDDVFRHFIENECKSQQHDRAILENQDFFNCPTQKISIKKNIQPKVTSSIHDKEIENLIDHPKLPKSNASASKIIHDDLTQVPEMDDDFFNCATQKLSTSKNIFPKPKVSSTIHDEETQELLEFSKSCKSNSILSKSYSTSIHEKNTQNPNKDDDFFNCPTQKLSTSKNIFSNTKVSLSIHEEETQRPPVFSQFEKTNNIASNNYSTNIDKELTDFPEMDDDFFNCPSQKVSTAKKVRPKVTTSIHDEETQELLDFSKPCKNDSISSKSYFTSIHEENTQNLNIDDDFFNCPTQKVSITKKINPKPKVSSSIHDEETQELLEFSKPYKSNSIVSKSYSNSKHEENPKIDDDFFNCPTQKLSTSNQIIPKSKVSSSIHEEETQKPPEFSQFDKTNNINSNNYSTNVDKDLTEVPEMDIDFFNCPTQRVSITKKIKPKVSSSIHDEETQELLEFSKPCKSNSILSKRYSTSIHEENTQNPKIDDDFFNCPTQKLSTSKNIFPNTKVSPSIHEEETQKPPEFSQFDKTNNIASDNYSTNVDKDLTEVPEMDIDFFNCPTQRVSITKKIKPKVSSSIHDKETQELLEFSKPCKSNSISSKSYSTSIHEENTQNLNIDDDFFNCPTQKLSTSKNIFPNTKVSSSIHDEETQELLEFSILSKSYFTSKHEENTQNPKIDDDFFNCPTQKVSITKKINPKPKVSSSIHDEETQELLEFSKPCKSNSISSKSYSTSIHEENTQNLNIDDDFFNCPTQKLSTSKNIFPNTKVSLSIHEEETQRPPEFSQSDKTNTITSKTYSTNIYEENTQNPKIDDDFFNCPTQQVSISKKINPKPKVSSSIHDKETQELLEFSKPCKSNSISSKSYSTSIHEENTQNLNIDDDFFNCPTQKLSTSKNIFQNTKVSLSIHEEETQRPPEFSQFDKTNNIGSNNYSTNSHVDLTEVPEIDDDFFNCPTQKVPCNSNSKFSTDCKKHESIPIVINEAETKDLSIQSISKISLPNNIKQNKRNIVNSTSQKVLTKVQSKSISNCSININEDVTKNPEQFDGTNSHKETDNEDRCKVQKSKLVQSNIISLSNVQIPVMCNEYSSNSLRTNKPKIRVREDLHNMSHSGSSSNNSMIIINKPNKKSVFNNINTTVPFNKNFDTPGCSKTAIQKNNPNASASTKQEYFIDDSDHSQVSISLKYNNHLKQINESIFSPLNIPDVSANSLLEDHSSPITIENNLNALKCEPSTSSNDAFKWKSFWNKKKIQSQDKGKSIKIAPEVKENKERYQTRAITRKRKQNGIVESNKKLCNRNNILEPLVENSSEIVVSFSYLKSRHLQEMKQFVEKTGGMVTDDITQCTVLVTDKIRCTMKILSAIAKGCPIVNANWLKHSYTVKMFQDVDDFIIADKDAERKYNFQLKKSLAKAKTKRLLDGYNVLVTPSVKPSPQEMKVIITCAGGNFVLNWTTTQYTKELIVTCDKDRTRWKPAWDNDLAKIIDSDTLVMSIIRQQLTI